MERHIINEMSSAVVELHIGVSKSGRYTAQTDTLPGCKDRTVDGMHRGYSSGYVYDFI